MKGERGINPSTRYVEALRGQGFVWEGSHGQVREVTVMEPNSNGELASRKVAVSPIVVWEFPGQANEQVYTIARPVKQQVRSREPRMNAAQ